ncbi:bifunctional 2-polyprenyl-6-hydroxyphenol methylase/3-demethylubiquinol 3-O-methyltransferase UbiG [uncultured Salipiger sp.]|uniref:bifunctional 2-polyprenyl-6-hydroxyphenol methylase/3-demethylubiquinol 3-O-methyltransferase UbiG n=1 Tax=uncultured Salipiger sp. TaxID=499810 RepID=UPI0025985692|nr:bifunctional 2-polyprenyl-6-hydroxyphenol methylase/3-demethylubiquinol 3-O-methyltransferase UbiG [uncultured Salipiger sp.]
MSVTVDPSEIAKFEAMSAEWWDPHGKFKPLHMMNPVRLDYITRQVAGEYGRDLSAPRPFEGLRIVDIGCGGGLITEPLARLGAEVTGIDASSDSIEIARRHAGTSGLSVTYVNAPPESLAEGEQVYDAVISMEVIEHTVDAGLFIEASVRLIRPGGLFIGATLNRTLKSLVLGKIAAEYVLGWVPPGTHDWRKFVRPSELAAGLKSGGADITELKGMSYDPIGDEWRLSGDLAVNYLAFAVKR